ncbi:glutaredoxin-C9-like protein [Cinnamomum micranthum f. kanehirae]|uniref:Glutaredoxin-C9-like protein n=1 Tax=Cinnamomum micranthum f. kanehirae TaxID=337451 RepID=A0A443PFU3_9MAGN|nr:glutaredoxin-C9-like protein [Cinnamomum micranthum f. kanehirae]
MQQAIPYRTWPLVSTNNRIDILANVDNRSSSNSSRSDRIQGLVSENPVLVIGRLGCCMCHVVRRLLLGLGVNPAMYEVKEDEEVGVVEELAGVSGDQRLQFPAVFIGGKLVGGLDRLMAVHISGDLVPILKEAGALWL